MKEIVASKIIGFTISLNYEFPNRSKSQNGLLSKVTLNQESQRTDQRNLAASNQTVSSARKYDQIMKLLQRRIDKAVPGLLYEVCFMKGNV